MKKLCLGLLAVAGIVASTASLAAPFAYPFEVGVVNRSQASVYVDVPAIGQHVLVNAHGAGNIWNAANMARDVYIRDANQNTLFMLSACPHANIELDTIPSNNSLTVVVSDARNASGGLIDPNCTSHLYR